MLRSLAFTAPPGEFPAPQTAVLLAVADPVRHRRPIRITYTAGRGGAATAPCTPTGWSSFWPGTSPGRTPGSVRTGPSGSIASQTPGPLPGSLEPPAGLDPAQRVLSGLAQAPYRHRVILRIHGTLEQIRARLPVSVARVEEPRPRAGADPQSEPWLRVELRAEQLGWLPAVLASLDRPFIIERPDELRGLVIAVADRLTTSARRLRPSTAAAHEGLALRSRLPDDTECGQSGWPQSAGAASPP